ncbi:FYN-binding protein 1 [Chanos chanos]|uniref:FYN-binding protein 1 n=1 Tax=Chanos chanos TaxID=29144 RepID=A0A6J2W9D0_CHACN|nr:FYN-binding protein 1-like [Chanos chanos]
MEESVDVKALRARFHEQAAMAAAAAGAVRTQLSPGEKSGELAANGTTRNKPSPVPPRTFPPPNPMAEKIKPVQAPRGIFPRPPPSYRPEARESPASSPAEPERTGLIRAKGEMLQNLMLKQQGESPARANPPIPSLRTQRSTGEVPPLRKPLPNVGPRPQKPKRPPHVSLDHIRKKIPGQPGLQTPEGPPRPPNKPSNSIQSFSNLKPDNSLPPPPPPPPKHSGSRDSWRNSFSSQVDEDSDQSDIYEPVDEREEAPRPPAPPRPNERDLRRQHDQQKKDQRVREKKEKEYLKKFKLTEPVEVLHIARIRQDWQGGKNDLSVLQGESVEILRVKNTPGGKWLARTANGAYGYISTSCVDVDYEEVKRKIRSEAPPPVLPHDSEVYDDIGSSDNVNSFDQGDDIYDDVDPIPDDFPLPPPEISQKSKSMMKEEETLRKKFKFEGPIKVIGCMMVDPNANIKRGGSKDLTVTRGEILDVIQLTNDKKALCRNEQGKYGYVPRAYLLQAEGEIYDDIDNRTDVYDNDASGMASRRP